jgi:glycosyltransferase involved in cell wall biosynthesis
LSCFSWKNRFGIPIQGGIELRVIQVSGKNPFAAEPSGTSSYVANLIKIMEEKPIDVTLISTEINYDKHVHGRFEILPITLKKVTSITFLLKLMIKAPFLKFPKDAIIHTHRPDFMIPFIIFWRRNPKVCTLHGIPDIAIKTRKNPIIWRIYNILERSSLKRTNRLIAVNRATKEYYVKRQPKLKNKIAIIPVGIDLDTFKPIDKYKMRRKYGFKEDDFIILSICRFSIEKGLDLLLQAFKDFQSEIPKSRLVLLGKGPEENRLKDIIKNEHIENVTFMPPLRHEKIPEIINSADTLALTSSFEGMPTVVLEALACGVPVVSTDVGDVEKVVLNGETGYLIKNRRVDTIKNGFINISKKGREEYGIKCVAMSRKYSLERIVDKIIDVYKEVDI